MKTVTILGVAFNAMSQDELMGILLGFLDGERNHVVVTPNPEGVMRASREPDFMRVLNEADLSLPDGIGIVLASRILGCTIPNRLRGVDTVQDLFDAAKHQSRSVYLLGAASGVAETAKHNIERQYKGMNVVGYHDGFFNEKEERIIIDEIIALKPNILVIGMGMPRQERWAVAHREELPVKITICVGGTIDILSGNVKLTPNWMRRLGLEWLHRLLRQPSRARRMLDLPRFVWAVIRARNEV